MHAGVNKILRRHQRPEVSKEHAEAARDAILEAGTPNYVVGMGGHQWICLCCGAAGNCISTAEDEDFEPAEQKLQEHNLGVVYASSLGLHGPFNPWWGGDDDDY